MKTLDADEASRVLENLLAKRDDRKKGANQQPVRQLAWSFGLSGAGHRMALGLDILWLDPLGTPDPMRTLRWPADMDRVEGVSLDELWQIKETISRLGCPTTPGRDCRYFPLPEVDAQWWSELSQADLLWWEGEPPVPLRPGPVRPVTPEWSVTPQAAHPAWAGLANGALVLPVENGVYVDPKAGLTGCIEHTLPQETARCWGELVLRGTPVEEVTGKLRRELTQQKLPLPPSRATGSVDKMEEPTPWLILGGGKQGGLVRMAFSYSFGLVQAGSTDGPGQRNMAFEERRLRRSLEAGLRRSGEGHRFSPGDSPDDWARFLTREWPVLEREGWRMSIDPEFPYKPVQEQEWFREDKPARGGLLEFELGLRIDGERINLLPMLVELLQTGRSLDQLARGPLVVPGGHLVSVPSERLRRVLGLIQQILEEGGELRRGRLTYSPLLHGGELEEVVPASPSAGKPRRVTPESKVERRPVVQGPFQARLRDYQKTGVQWMKKLAGEGRGGVLADEMGLGKTIQMLAFLHDGMLKGLLHGPALVVCPTSVAPNWIREARRFCPGWNTIQLKGPHRHRLLGRLKEQQLVVISYDLLRRDVEPLAGIPFSVVLLDEAQWIKNAQTGAARAVRRLQAGCRMALTGTPVENRIGEIWSIFHFLMPGCLGSREGFEKTYGGECEPALRESLRLRLAPFVLRRTKAEVLTELPPKTEVLRTIEMSEEQADLYESLRLSAHRKVRREIKRLGLQAARMSIFQALTQLRQVCCDPALLSREELGRDVGSAKLEVLCSMMKQLRAEGRRTLVFSQFTSMLERIAARLQKMKIPFLSLTGASRDRGGLVERFQQGEAPFFLISLRAGGAGITLTAADTVIHYEPWWNPAVEAQASDRAHRLGQTCPVTIYRLVASGTIEEKILEMQESKKRLFQELFDGGGTDDVARIAEWLLADKPGENPDAAAEGPVAGKKA